MALRSVRIYFRVKEKRREFKLNKELWLVFTLYMDAVMRGRFRNYTGPEVKGVAIANLNLVESHLQRDKSGPTWKAWTAVLNTYQYDVEFDYSKLTGTTHDKINLLIDTFLKYAARSPLPQMKILVEDIQRSRATIDVGSIIERAVEVDRKLGGKK
jgi:hypothetical protein